MTPEMIEVFRVPGENLGELKSRMARLQKRAAKLNVGSVGFEEVGTEEWREGENINSGSTTYYKPGEVMDVRVTVPTGRVRIVHLIRVFGEAPKLAGWEFVAVVQHLRNDSGEAIGNILRIVPGCEKKVPEKYRNAETWCDHCKTSRRRIDTFVVMNEAGETKQVGRNCLVDFLGHASPEAYARMAEYLLDASELGRMAEGDGFGGGRGELMADLNEVLVKTSAVIRLHGWVSRKTAMTYGKNSTSNTVSNWIFDRKFDAKKEGLKIEERDREMATECQEWMEVLPVENVSDEYRYSLALLGRANIIPMRNMGLACSAVSAMMRDKDREIARRAKLDMHKGSKFVGEVGARIEFDATLEWTFQFEGNFGVTTLYKFLDAEGNLVVWFASSPFCPGPVSPDRDEPNEEIEVGQRVKIMGTIKKHEERDGIKQTIVTRVKESLTKAEKKARKADYAAKAFEYYAKLGYCTRCYGGTLTEYGAPTSEGCFACEATGYQNFALAEPGQYDWFREQNAKLGAYLPLPQAYPLTLQFYVDAHKVLKKDEEATRKANEQLKQALNGFPDVNTSRDHYLCMGYE